MKGVIIQCRMASTRLPGKCMLKFPNGKTVIETVIERAKKISGIDKVIVAIPNNEVCTEMAQLILNSEVDLFAGHRTNVWQRFSDCIQNNHLTYVIRITADDPFRSPSVEAMNLAKLIESGMNYAYTTGLPYGINAEAFKTEAFLKQHPDEETKEHVTTLFRRGNSSIKTEYTPDLSHVRLTLDTEEDWKLIMEEWHRENNRQ